MGIGLVEINFGLVENLGLVAENDLDCVVAGTVAHVAVAVGSPQKSCMVQVETNLPAASAFGCTHQGRTSFSQRQWRTGWTLQSMKILMFTITVCDTMDGCNAGNHTI